MGRPRDWRIRAAEHAAQAVGLRFAARRFRNNLPAAAALLDSAAAEFEASVRALAGKWADRYLIPIPLPPEGGA